MPVMAGEKGAVCDSGERVLIQLWLAALPALSSGCTATPDRHGGKCLGAATQATRSPPARFSCSNGERHRLHEGHTSPGKMYPSRSTQQCWPAWG